MSLNWFSFVLGKKNPACERHWISQPMRIEATVSFLFNFYLCMTCLGGIAKFSVQVHSGWVGRRGSFINGATPSSFSPIEHSWFNSCKNKQQQTNSERGGGTTNEWPGTDHVMSGPVRGLTKMHLMAHTNTHTHTHTHGHGDSMTESAKWGWFS